MTRRHAASSKVHLHSSVRFSPGPVASFGSKLPWTLPLAFHPSVTSDAERDWRQPRTLGWELLLHSTQATSCRTEARSSYKRRGDSQCLHRLNDPVGMGEVRYLAKHGSRATVAFLGKLYRACHRFRLNMVAEDLVLYGNLNKHHRVFFGAHAPDMHLVVGHRLSLLAQYRDDIHPGTASQAN